MKVIDLLNKIANGEEVPEKIRFDSTYWKRKIGEKNVYYVDEDDKIDLFVYLFRYNLTFTLNDEVEIIEEKKIPEKLDEYANVSGDLACDWTFGEKKLKDKINEIIDYLDYLKSKGE